MKIDSQDQAKKLSRYSEEVTINTILLSRILQEFQVIKLPLYIHYISTVIHDNVI